MCLLQRPLYCVLIKVHHHYIGTFVTGNRRNSLGSNIDEFPQGNLLWLFKMYETTHCQTAETVKALSSET